MKTSMKYPIVGALTGGLLAQLVYGGVRRYQDGHWPSWKQCGVAFLWGGAMGLGVGWMVHKGTVERKKQEKTDRQLTRRAIVQLQQKYPELHATDPSLRPKRSKRGRA